MKVAVGADHAGYELKERVKQYLERHGHTVLDMGTNSTESTDYPQYAFRVAEAVRDGVADRGVLVCDTGNGIAIAANKVEGIRAALVIDPKHAEMSRRHNDANVLVLGGRLMGTDMAADILQAWLETDFAAGRHARRVAKIADVESRHAGDRAHP